MQCASATINVPQSTDYGYGIFDVQKTVILWNKACMDKCLYVFMRDIHRLNMELDLQSLFELHVHSCTHWLNPPPPRIWAHIRGRYWSRSTTSLCDIMVISNNPDLWNKRGICSIRTRTVKTTVLQHGYENILKPHSPDNIPPSYIQHAPVSVECRYMYTVWIWLTAWSRNCV